MKKNIKNSVDDLQLYFAQDMQAVDKLINSYITSNATPVISELSNHLINAGGKRLRPLLTLAASDLCNYSGASHIKLAAAIEFIHTATLLHDDVVDESFQRRGKPTANILWDNQSSVLVGDYLFSKSFQLMVETDSLKVLSILADASSTISEGEILQLSAVRNIKTDESAYFKIIEGKTAALFSAATEVGAVISNVERKKADALANFGKALGISFQITDDLLDYVGSYEVLGKNIGDDFKEGKVTLPLIKAISKSSKEEKRFWKEVINKGMQKSSDLEHALLLMRQHNVFDETRSEAIKWSKKARNYLDIFRESKTKVILQELTYFVVERIT